MSSSGFGTVELGSVWFCGVNVAIIIAYIFIVLVIEEDMN